jgi:hypothetical protein
MNFFRFKTQKLLKLDSSQTTRLFFEMSSRFLKQYVN